MWVYFLKNVPNGKEREHCHTSVNKYLDIDIIPSHKESYYTNINKIHISVAILKHFVYFSIKIKQK